MEFLDYLTKILGCEYLSDLRFLEITAEESIKLLQADIEMFSLHDYQVAANYLLNHDSSFCTAEDARAAIVACLCRKK